MSYRMTYDWALYEIASNIESWEHLCKVQFTLEEKDCLHNYLQIYKRYLYLHEQIRKLKQQLPPHPQINDVTKTYKEVSQESDRIEEEINRLVESAPLQNVLSYRFHRKPQQQQKQEIITESKTPPLPETKPIAAPPKQESKIRTVIETIRSFLPSIPFSFLGLLEFYIIYGLSALAVALVFLVLSYIPIINTLVDWLFRIRQDTPDMFTMMVAVGLAYLGTTATAEHIIKGTRKHALMLTGIYLVVLNIIFLIVNLINSDDILPNIIIGIAGIVMFYKNKEE